MSASGSGLAAVLLVLAHLGLGGCESFSAQRKDLQLITTDDLIAAPSRWENQLVDVGGTLTIVDEGAGEYELDRMVQFSQGNRRTYYPQEGDFVVVRGYLKREESELGPRFSIRSGSHRSPRTGGSGGWNRVPGATIFER